MKEKKKIELFSPLGKDEYIGNIFGWKISIAGLIAIIFFLLLYQFGVRQNEMNDVQPQEGSNIETIKDESHLVKDSLELK